MTHNIITDAILTLALPTATGYLLITSLLGNRSTLAERASLAYPAGLSILSITLFLLGWAGIPFTAAPIIATLSILMLPLWATIRHSKIRVLNIKNSSIEEYMTLPPVMKAVTLILITWLALKIYLAYAATAAMPAWGPDSKYTWTVRALIFYAEKGLHLTPDNFFLKTVGQPTYPPFAYMNQVWLAIIHGSFDKTIVKMWAPGFLACMALFAYATARRCYGIPGSLLAAIIAITAPLTAIHVTEPYADFPIAFFYVAALVFFWRQMRQPKTISYAAASGLFAAFAINAKLEGTVFAFILTASFAAWAYTQPAAVSRLKSMAAYTAPMLLALPYHLFRMLNSIGFHQTYLEPQHTNTLVPLSQLRIFPLVFSHLFLPDNIGVIATFGLVCLLYIQIKKRKPIPGLYRLLAVPACYIAFLFALYTFSAPHKDFLESATIFYRNMIALYPAALLIFFVIHKDMIQAGDTSTCPTYGSKDTSRRKITGKP